MKSMEGNPFSSVCYSVLSFSALAHQAFRLKNNFTAVISTLQGFPCTPGQIQSSSPDPSNPTNSGRCARRTNPPFWSWSYSTNVNVVPMDEVASAVPMQQPAEGGLQVPHSDGASHPTLTLSQLNYRVMHQAEREK